MEEWKEYKLGELYDVHNGLSKGGKFFGSGYPFLSFSTVFKNYFLPQELTNLVQSSEKEQSNFSINEGDVFITRTSESADELGMSSVALKDYPNATYNGFTKRLRPKGVVEIYPKYIGYYLRSPRFRNNFYGITSSMSTRASLSNGDLLNMKVILPLYATQQKIANILSSLDDKIEVNRRINEQLEELAQALFKSWFVDFEPFKDGEFVESELGMIPKGWKVGDIYEHLNVIYGAPYKSSLFNDKGDGLPLIRIRDLKTNAPQFYTPEILPNTEYVNIGDVVAGMDAEFVPYIWLGAKGVLNQRCCKFVAKDKKISNYYIINTVKPKLEFVQSYKTGTTVSHLGKSDIDRFRVVNPPLNVLVDFSEKVNPLLARKIALAKEIHHLTTLRDTLLPKLMSGEIDVNEVEI